jgi:hypothetical protein
MKTHSPSEQLSRFIAKYTPEIAVQAHAILAKMQKVLPGSVELVYDNYNALAIGLGPSERASEAVFSIALYPRWISLFFLQAAGLPDPKKLLKGNGKVARHIVLETPATLDDPAVRALMKQAMKIAAVPINAKSPSRIVIKSISVRQRPRRPKPSVKLGK